MTRRLALALCAATLASACSSATAPAPAGFADQFEAVWSRYDQTYPYFDYKRLNWDSIGTVYRARAATAASEAELAGVVRDMLGNLRDIHSWLTDPTGKPVGTYSPTAFMNWRADVWQAYVQRATSLKPQPSNWGYAMFGPVPYLYVGAWSPAQVKADAVDAVIDQLKDAPAMIIDVRMNGGGDNSLAFAVAGRFFDARHTISYVRYRSGPSHGDLGALQPITVDPRGSSQFRKPVLLLTGRGMFSTSEEFVMALSQLTNVTTAGDTTGGGSGNPAMYDLGGGWQYSVPRWIEYTTSMDVVEWRGLAPRVYVPMSASDLAAGRDPVFDYALQWARAFGFTGNQSEGPPTTPTSRR